MWPRKINDFKNETVIFKVDNTNIATFLPGIDFLLSSVILLKIK